ncbi:Zinc finger protein 64-like, isoforms 1 and 2 [Acipenser ruthenus]|uniref:Zinc finger protein 64-like, isoforms 1 and 2 n=1 Tax=Acipenser ruthenus TaxID=7906 RepID=A0A662YPN1_ACIRT|nr:Zinc finger protein 64-like, isoforms 1 and 2 [Acipenser ruthenus]
MDLNSEKPFKCDICSKLFSRKDKLTMHSRSHTGEKPHKCKYCSYAAADSSSLKKHLRIHYDERPFKCQICPYASRNSSQLTVHLRSHTGKCIATNNSLSKYCQLIFFLFAGDAPFQCHLCEAKFKINSDLKRHMRIHSGEKPYKCEFCEYCCAMKGNLKSHIQLKHSTENAFKCTQCDFQCRNKTSLRQHAREHQPEQPIKCLKCSYSCSNKTALKVHERIHSEDRPFKCEYCNFDTKQRSNLIMHEKKFHANKVKTKGQGKVRKVEVCPKPGRSRYRAKLDATRSFRCDICEASFVREDSLRSHRKQHVDAHYYSLWRDRQDVPLQSNQVSSYSDGHLKILVGHQLGQESTFVHAAVDDSQYQPKEDSAITNSADQSRVDGVNGSQMVQQVNLMAPVQHMVPHNEVNPMEHQTVLLTHIAPSTGDALHQALIQTTQVAALDSNNQTFITTCSDLEGLNALIQEGGTEVTVVTEGNPSVSVSSSITTPSIISTLSQDLKHKQAVVVHSGSSSNENTSLMVPNISISTQGVIIHSLPLVVSTAQQQSLDLLSSQNLYSEPHVSGGTQVLVEVGPDIHICGICKQQYNNFEDFLAHKQNGCQMTPTAPPAPSNVETVSDAASECVFEEGYQSCVPRGNKKVEVKTQKGSSKKNRPALLSKRLCCCFQGDAPFQCHLCEAKFKINSDLKRHMRIHSGEKPYKCEFCEYCCAMKGNLKSHIQLKHSTENAFKCTQCDFQCRNKTSLRQHAREHQPEQPIKCLKCSYSCSNKTALKVHERIHSEDRPFKCEYCNFDTKQRSNLIMHNKKFHANKVKTKGQGKVRKVEVCPKPGLSRYRAKLDAARSFRCDICEASFVREDSLRSHRKQHADTQMISNTALAVLQIQMHHEDQVTSQPQLNQLQVPLQSNQVSSYSDGHLKILVGHQLGQESTFVHAAVDDSQYQPKEDSAITNSADQSRVDGVNGSQMVQQVNLMAPVQHMVPHNEVNPMEHQTVLLTHIAPSTGDALHQALIQTTQVAALDSNNQTFITTCSDLEGLNALIQEGGTEVTVVTEGNPSVSVSSSITTPSIISTLSQDLKHKQAVVVHSGSSSNEDTSLMVPNISISTQGVIIHSLPLVVSTAQQQSLDLLSSQNLYSEPHGSSTTITLQESV